MEKKDLFLNVKMTYDLQSYQLKKFLVEANEIARTKSLTDEDIEVINKYKQLARGEEMTLKELEEFCRAADVLLLKANMAAKASNNKELRKDMKDLEEVRDIISEATNKVFALHTKMGDHLNLLVKLKKLIADGIRKVEQNRPATV